MTDYTPRRIIMVDSQVRPSDVTKFPIIEAMLTVPREEFVPEAQREAAYVGENLEIGGGRIMLEPRTLAKLVDLLDIQPEDRVLVVGAGLGYSAAIMDRIAGSVVALEEVDALATGLAGRFAGSATVTVRHGALAAGAAADGPFDRILIEGGVERMPKAFAAQLVDGGRIGAVFMTGALGEARIGYHEDGDLYWRYAFNAAAPIAEGFAAEREFAF